MSDDGLTCGDAVQIGIILTTDLQDLAVIMFRAPDNNIAMRGSDWRGQSKCDMGCLKVECYLKCT